jgi:hypothetical protein
MLKIKDNVDLKELEKFKFKPTYNKDTGEIEEYMLDTSSKYHKTYVKITHLYKLNKWLVPFKGMFKIKNRTILFVQYLGGYFDEIQQDLLYDLIKAGLVEKVEE